MQQTHAFKEREALLNRVEASKRSHLNANEDRAFTEICARLRDLDLDIKDEKAKEQRQANLSPEAKRVIANQWVDLGDGSSWAFRAAKALGALGVGENRGVVSGSINAPALVSPSITPKSRPVRLVDLLVNRTTLTEAATFEYLRQTLRTNAAAPVADLATKPTSTFTLVPIPDRARVLAHLSEPFPIRYFMDHLDVVQWLEVEMEQGVLSALESQVISGSGSGENLTGVLNVAGTTQVAFATDVPTTLRKAITALQAIGVQPKAWAINPADAEALDLLKEGTEGVGFLLDGVNNGTANSGNVLGDSSIQRVISPSVPAGQAILADWNAVRLYVREDIKLDFDYSGENFTKNQAVARAEMRVGLGHLHPASFAIADLTA
ncbi:phage major capsid protein [Mycolicibacterium gilvum]|uniref:phage major capsid protein n=1 Tax=Mycolicibacterium gilvum TaxID=1804 RepID=UPI000313A54F|nr:phage major capsid protein [Mycolicibacterium gilvum]